MKSKTLSMKISCAIAIAIAIVCLLVAAFVFSRCYIAKANDVTIEGSDDEFELIDTCKGGDEAFCFSATANFERGNAAGLVFGATDGETYWVFNVDRADNAVKLMYFDYTSGDKQVYVIYRENYVGTDLMNPGEREYVKSRTASIDKVYLKVIVAPTEDGVFAEFYADGIRRFCYTDGSEDAAEIDLNAVKAGEDEQKTLTYGGGNLGYNCFNARVKFTDEIIGETDYSAYTEIYRNQYHFSQYAHWNNDPNGLVYYKGWYHMYFQHNPYGNTWDAMHWGHARSRDLAHWELLPIALVPDRDLSIDENGVDHGIGAMWSGSARVYHKGDSDTIDNDDRYKWFGDVSDKQDGEALGLIGFYTRFDDVGNRHQVVMYSTDGGLSWNKRDNIPNTTSLDLDGNPVVDKSWRDPKVFDISGLSGNSDGYKWGMALTDMERNTLFFLKSKNLVNWEHAGCYYVYRPECPDVVFLNDGNKDRAVITFTSRYYVVCDLSYEGGHIVMRDSDGAAITKLERGDEHLVKMDYGVDSYAAQTFFIDENSDSAYAGKSVSMSWFSGVPNDKEWSIESGVLQTARKVWNGGGMTIPVVYGLDGERLTTTPVTATDPTFAELKTSLVNIENKPVEEGMLSGAKSHTAEIVAKLSNPSREAVSIKVNMSADGECYTEIGWNKEEGYFVDRTHTEDAGIIFPQPNYRKRYASGMGKDNAELDFYILVDRNNVEVYCDGFTVPFYILTFASPYSLGMDLTAAGDAIAQELKVNEIGTVWRGESEENALVVSDSSVELDVTLCTEREVTVVSDGEIEYEIVEGSDVVELERTAVGFKVRSLVPGNASIAVRSGKTVRVVPVTVTDGSPKSNMTFSADGVVSGKWLFSGDVIIGEQPGGDGFLLSDEIGDDFIYGARFDLGSGAAAAIVLRAEQEGGKLKSYIIANYDINGKVVKLWSQNREIAKRENVTPADISDITLIAFVNGKNIRITLDGNTVIEATLGDNDPVEGAFGLNACATRATFKAVYVTPYEAQYAGEGPLEIATGINTSARVVNRTLANTEVPSEYYTVTDGALYIDVAYVSLLPKAGKYVYSVYGDAYSYDVTVDVKAVPDYYTDYVSIKAGSDAVAFIGKRTTEYLLVNGKAIPSSAYGIENYRLTVSGDYLEVGDNSVELSDRTYITVSVSGVGSEIISIYHPPVPLDLTPVGIGLGITIGILALCLIAFIVLFVLWRKGKVNIEKPFSDRTEAVRRRNLGLIVGACIAGSIALVFVVCAATAPIGNGGFVAAAVLTVIFGYPYAAQLPWKGKLYAQTLGPIKTSGTPKAIFDVDKSGNKFYIAMRYVAAAFKVLWLGIKIAFFGIIAMIRAPFLFVGQTKAVTYGEFGHSNKADSVERNDKNELDAAKNNVKEEA